MKYILMVLAILASGSTSAQDPKVPLAPPQPSDLITQSIENAKALQRQLERQQQRRQHKEEQYDDEEMSLVIEETHPELER